MKSPRLGAIRSSCQQRIRSESDRFCPTLFKMMENETPND